MLGQSSNLKEVLWNFSRFRDETKRLTLKQNPHFYDSEVLPTLPEKYGGKFRTDPVDTFRHKRSISVLTDNSGPTGRVFLETTTETRAFGNVWVPNDAIIFKGSCLFLPPFPTLTFYQTFAESLRVKASSVRPSKTHPYGVLRSFHRLPPLGRLNGVAHCLLRIRHQRHHHY